MLYNKNIFYFGGIMFIIERILVCEILDLCGNLII